MTAPTVADLAQPHPEPAPSQDAALPTAGRDGTPPLSWICLIVGTALTAVVGFQTPVPVAAWLAPLFLLRFVRTSRLVISMPALAVANAAALVVAMRNGFFPGSGVGFMVFVAIVSALGVLPFLADRLIAPRLAAAAGTLVFPAAATALEWLGTFGNAYGTAGSVAYSQSADLPLLQLASVTGLWGITFLVNWLGAVVNLLWEGRARPRPAVYIFVGTVLAVLIAGGARVAFLVPQDPTVTVAALAPDGPLSQRLKFSQLPAAGTAAEREAARVTLLDPIVSELFERTRIAAAGGAKIITWSEAAVYVYPEDVASLLQRASAVARETQVYLQIGVIVLLPNDELPFNENRAILFDPAGVQVWDYAKSQPTPGDGQLPGPGVLPIVDTPYGTLSTVICQDDMFPGLLRQAGRAGADIVLVPSSDWPAIATWHAQLDPVRAVENGFSVVRATRWGNSLATDWHGRPLARKTDTGPDQTMFAAVPTQGRPTLHTSTGDLFAYLSSAALLALGLAVRYRRGGLPSTTQKGHHS